MEDFILRYIESTSQLSKYKNMCYKQKKDLIDNNCNKNKHINNCDILIKLYNDCINFKIKKSK